jgi:predicted MFS family arabinose efflux permease
VNGGIALGSWAWGAFAQHHAVSTALLVSGCMLVLSPIVTGSLRIPDRANPEDTATIASDDP